MDANTSVFDTALLVAIVAVLLIGLCAVFPHDYSHPDCLIRSDLRSWVRH
jgi:hypothetical protein